MQSRVAKVTKTSITDVGEEFAANFDSVGPTCTGMWFFPGDGGRFLVSRLGGELCVYSRFSNAVNRLKSYGSGGKV